MSESIAPSVTPSQTAIVRKACADGVRAARRQTRIGAIFLGSIPAAQAAGYSKETSRMAYVVFSACFHGVVEKLTIVTTQDGVVLSNR